MSLARSGRASAAALGSMGLGAGCGGPLSTLDPAGPLAQQAANLAWIMFAISAAVTAFVVLLLGWAVWRGRRSRGDEPPPLDPLKLLVGGGIVLPLLVLPIVWVLSLTGMAALAGPPLPAAVAIDVTSERFAYRARYPERGVELRDEVRIPAGQPVLLRLHSADVIHSFWVPRLGMKMDMVPGQTNEVWIEASQPGTYAGQCAEYCGIGHTDMRLVVIALEPADFEAWLAGAARAGP